MAFTVFDDGRVVFRYENIPDTPPFEVEIRCPLAASLHQEHEQILEQHRAWARDFEVLPNSERYQRYCDTRFDLLAAYQYHGLPLEAAVTAAHLMTWFFVYDDVMDIKLAAEREIREYRSRLCSRHMEMLSGAAPQQGDPRIVHAFADYLRRVRQTAHGPLFPWYERMAHHLREYVTGACWESVIGPTTAANSNTAMYLQVRHMSVGVAPCLDLMAAAKRIPSEPVASSFFIQRLERLAINFSIWINDLAGLGRDTRRGLGNVIFTLQQDHALSLKEAAQMVGRMCNGELEAFLTVEKQLPRLAGAEYERNRTAYDSYTDVLKRWMRGLLDWSVRSPRYQRLDVDMALQNDSLIRQASKTARSGEGST